MRNRAKIITFYSYKGGVGRSMALANVAWLLASMGNRVLTIDWDLEAPGLPRYFGPFLDPHTLASSHGLIELFTDHVARSGAAQRAIPTIGRDPTQYAKADLSTYVVPLNWQFPNEGRLDLLPAGRPGPAYARLVMQFDWEQLYTQFGGHELLEDLKAQARSTYDYVLIDSRTGLTDTSGICTIQLPDALVVCFSLNRQSVEGSAAVAESVQAQRSLHTTDEPLKIFPVPMRVELAERQKLESARELVVSKFTRFLGHLNNEQVSAYWSAVEIMSYPFYSYEEILCAFGDAPGQLTSMSASIERLAGYLTDDPVSGAPNIDDVTRRRVLDAFAHSVTATPTEGRCFISYSSKDAPFAEKVHADLEHAGVRCWFAPHDLPIGAKIRSDIDRAIHEVARVLLILSTNSISSAWVEKEVETAFERESVTGRTLLLPLRLDDAIMQAREGWAADIRRQRNIGDFTAWQDSRSYASALSRLLKSLRT